MRIQRPREKAQKRSFILPPMPLGGIDYIKQKSVTATAFEYWSPQRRGPYRPRQQKTSGKPEANCFPHWCLPGTERHTRLFGLASDFYRSIIVHYLDTQTWRRFHRNFIQNSLVGEAIFSLEMSRCPWKFGDRQLGDLRASETDWR